MLGDRLGDVHAGFVPGLVEGGHYGLRAAGPFDPKAGYLFDPSKLLTDPLALAIDRPYRWHPDLASFGKETGALAPRSVALRPPPPLAPLPPGRPGFIYEVQLKSFTALHPDVPMEQRGTFAALAHPAVIEHLTRIGVDTLEIMPVSAWIDERHLAQQGLSNAWGYNPVNFLAPDPRLAPGGLTEIRATIAALHEAGIRAVLDVVLNHTGEGDLGGPTLSLRGLDNALYFRTAAGALVNDAGCGNTLALDRAPVVSLAMTALRHWASLGFDGFRYDLATVMGRTPRGFEPDAPLLASIQQDPALRDLIHIAEPWDIGPGGYQLGRFPASWLEWNDRFREDARRFWRGDAGSAGPFATRLAGSSDLFDNNHRRPSASVNFVAAHDGFTLRDAVGYASKRNEANGEGNRDGNAHETSWIAKDPAAAARGLLASLFLARGTPMLTAGDEFGRSQRGNNNAYAQDNETAWLDWARADHALIAFTAALVRLRTSRSAFFADAFLTKYDAAWFDADGAPMTDDGWASKTLEGLTLVLRAGGERLALAFAREPASLRLPPAEESRAWRQIDGLPAYEEHGPPSTRQASDETITALALAAGVQPDWWEVNGRHHAVGLETKREMLKAMAFPVESETDCRAALHDLRTAKRRSSPSNQCYLPEDIAAGRRVFGVAAHLYALRDPRDSGIGDFETLARFGEAAKKLGGALCGLNPLHHMFPGDRKRVSPYQPSDRRFVDPIYIDIGEFQGGSKPAAILRSQSHVNYEGVWKLKTAALEKAFARRPPSSDFDAFIRAGGAALEHHASFEAKGDPEKARYAMWLQWVADRQLKRAAAAAPEFGLYRDLALGCAFDGGERAAQPGLFAAGVSIGAPPDPFSASGQVWNLPPYNPHRLAAENYRPYTEVLRANMRHAGVIRIDHVLGLARQFWVPDGAPGSDGAYVTFPLDDLIAAVAAESRRARCMVIGEDLGTVPDGLRKKLAAANILSYKVLWFEEENGRFHGPEAYPRLSAACLSSHDLPPFKGWLSSASPEDAAKLAAATGDGEPMTGAHAYLARMPSALMLAQADDLTGETEPLNVPGTDRERPNWRRRLSVSVEDLADRPEAKSVIAAVRKERP